ncbi:bifunctional 4-hydroxy-2-oxoglutarate aldolase/2-dehydro-3-deoxy-phosphogluconate aldolase [Halotalea alkalilenta]|uniref:2-dehydro-3-deoxy-phosphogluconate aldolase n=1 Tax=Halotalea alkalilenta TaxID=376489 RepID=A0A172YC63_9GAMM|nr:bifunctional 4-hydroxy-2-oxoglutarate aldolase/2-dehydro-3-deoxy-phosphogluconate aldolase [Halotalea alkalilenta]ANF56840.1 keto-deoxy-phosphogluconate aldolase [Halotalea alkalilenta]
MSEHNTLPPAMTEALDEICAQAKVIPVIVIERLEDAVPLGRALVEGGLPILEVTLRSDCALEAIAAMREALPEASVGAGTVITVEQYKQVEALGVDFVVTPGATPALLDYAVTSGSPVLPGIATISELMLGMEYGLRRFKFFPAESSGGAAAIKSFGGPIPQVRFCPTGGIGLANAGDYLKLPNVMCVGGSWVTPKALIDAKDWAGITKLAREAVERFA